MEKLGHAMVSTKKKEAVPEVTDKRIFTGYTSVRGYKLFRVYNINRSLDTNQIPACHCPS
jgi:hypothetical protein